MDPLRPLQLSNSSGVGGIRRSNRARRGVREWKLGISLDYLDGNESGGWSDMDIEPDAKGEKGGAKTYYLIISYC